MAAVAQNRTLLIFVLLAFLQATLCDSLAWTMPFRNEYVYIPLSPAAKATIASGTLRQAIGEYRNARFQDAVITVKEAIAKGLKDEELLIAYECLAYCYVAMDDLALARSAFRKLVSLDPDYAPDDPSPKVEDVFRQAVLAGTLKGRVTTSRGEPLAGASVVCGEASAVTDEDGRFDLEKVPPWELVVLAYKERYAAASKVVPRGLTARQLEEPIRLRIGRTAALEGLIQDEKGKAVARARITLIGRRPPFLVLETDREGRYSCPYVLSGDYG